MKTILQNRILVVLLSVFLTACGGGSGDSGESASSLSPTSTQSGGGSQSATDTDPVQNAPVQLSPSNAEPVSEVAAIRFLEQASFGPTPETVARVRELGFSAYLDEQMLAPSSGYPDPTEDSTLKSFKEHFFNNALNGSDQLRQRVAYAFGQIFVVSANDLANMDAITSYQRMLLENAFGTYSNLLEEVTLHPAMGRYLDMVNNAAGESPNENYAREVMQLFSIGTVHLNIDGTSIVDTYDIPMPTYTQKDVEELARALTGWTYPVTPGETSGTSNPAYYYGHMIPAESLHDKGEKTLLGGVILPAGQSAYSDLVTALNTIASHPNVAPFISFRMIQHLVTSNPSNDYVRRVATVFNDNGYGVRGDLKAVVKAILLDEEARRGDDPLYARISDGRMKEPALFITGLLRNLGVQSSGIGLSNRYSTPMGQDVLAAPSVFNFYTPDYQLPGTDTLAPEFEIFISPNIVARDNFVNAVVYEWDIDMVIDLTSWTNLAGNTEALMDTLNIQLFHGVMSDSTRNIIANTIDAMPNADNLTRAKAALYLAATSPEYSIQH